MLSHTTKNDIYAELIALGVSKRYAVIPEFRVDIPDDGGGRPAHTKDIDLVWARRLHGPSRRQACRWPEHWELVATFEIEACDVRNIPGKEFNRHILDLPRVANLDAQRSIAHFVVLYTSAHDRNWHGDRDVDAEISERRGWAKDTMVNVIDGRNLSPIHNLGGA